MLPFGRLAERDLGYRDPSGEELAPRVNGSGMIAHRERLSLGAPPQ